MKPRHNTHLIRLAVSIGFGLLLFLNQQFFAIPQSLIAHLGFPGNDGRPEVFGKHNPDQFVGRSTITSGQSPAFPWENGEVRDFGTNGINSYHSSMAAVALKRLGYIVGRLYDSIDAGNLAFPWEYGEAVSISSLPSEDGEWRLIYPPDNSDGNIIVESGNVAGRKHAPLLNPTWDELVSANQNYLPNDLMSEGLFSFEYWLEIGMEPTEFNFNLMMYNGTRWEFLGPEWIFVGSSSERLSAFLLVPEWARGIETEIFFMALDRSYSAFPDYWN